MEKNTIRPSRQFNNAPSEDIMTNASSVACELYCRQTKDNLILGDLNFYNIFTKSGFISKEVSHEKYLSDITYRRFSSALNFYKQNEQFCSNVKICKNTSYLAKFLEEKIIQGEDIITPKLRYIKFFTHEGHDLDIARSSRNLKVVSEKAKLLLEDKNGLLTQLSNLSYNVSTNVQMFSLIIKEKEYKVLSCEDIAYLYYFYLGPSNQLPFELGPKYELKAMAFSAKFSLTMENEFPVLEFPSNAQKIESCAFVMQDLKIKYINFWKFNL